MIEYITLGTLAIIAVVIIITVIVVSKSKDNISIDMDIKKGKLNIRKKGVMHRKVEKRKNNYLATSK